LCRLTRTVGQERLEGHGMHPELLKWSDDAKTAGDGHGLLSRWRTNRYSVTGLQWATAHSTGRPKSQQHLLTFKFDGFGMNTLPVEIYYIPTTFYRQYQHGGGANRRREQH
jgi:hypothetical protein